jgi:hypothetical protein
MTLRSRMRCIQRCWFLDQIRQWVGSGTVSMRNPIHQPCCFETRVIRDSKNREPTRRGLSEKYLLNNRLKIAACASPYEGLR